MAIGSAGIESELRGKIEIIAFHNLKKMFEVTLVAGQPIGNLCCTSCFHAADAPGKNETL